MQLFRPPDNSGLLPITYFHAMAELGVEGLVLIEPAARFVSLGCFDDAALVDHRFCRAQGIAVMRREVGGGTVLLGPGQVFYHLVARRGGGLVPGVVSDAFRHLSAAPIRAYARLGVPVSYRPINDLVTAGARKISGQGAADINGHFCYTGSILREFDVRTMASVLRTSDERERTRLQEALAAHMTWLARELGTAPASGTVADALAEGFASLLGPLTDSVLPGPVVTRARQLQAEMASPDALALDHPRPQAAIKIREGVYLRQAQAEIGIFRVAIAIQVQDDRIHTAWIHGFEPQAALEACLAGIPFTASAVQSALRPLVPEAERLAPLVRLLCG